MKKVLAILLMFTLLLCSCSSKTGEEELYSEDLIYRLSLCNLIMFDWNSPEEINPDLICTIYYSSSEANKVSVQYYNAETGESCFPKNLCEDYVKKYFDVSEEYLETAQAYNAETQTYDTFTGFGGARFIDSIKPQKDGNDIFVYVNYYDPETEEIVAQSIIKLIKTSNGYRYGSCKYVTDKNALV